MERGVLKIAISYQPSAFSFTEFKLRAESYLLLNGDSF